MKGITSAMNDPFLFIWDVLDLTIDVQRWVLLELSVVFVLLHWENKFKKLNILES